MTVISNKRGEAMKRRDWSEINRQCLEIFALERAAV